MARPIAVIDSETDPFLHGRIPAPFIWGFYDGSTYLEFLSCDDLVRYLRERRIIVYAHNGGKFDYHFLLDYLEPYSEIMIINGRLAKFKIGECEFRDSINIIPVGLKAYEKDDFDYALMEPDQRKNPENYSKIREYLRHDCEYLYTLITKFKEKFGINLTQAGTAMNQWKKISSKKPPRSTELFYQYFSRYYYGGRVECFKKGIIQSPFFVYDINSAYPYAMLQSHPFSVDAETISGKPCDLLGTDFYTVRAISAGALPFRDGKGKLLFPNDSSERIYNATGWEIMAALETGTVVVNEWIEYHRFTELIDFSEYINKYYLERKIAKAEKDKASDLFAKLLMNSLYGKFGANASKYKRYIILDPSDEVIDGQTVDYDESEFIINGRLGGKFPLAERGLIDDEKRYYNIATAASITGFVRAYLWRAVCACGIGNLLYCDTDSIAVGGVHNSLSIGAELGQWKNEGKFVKAAIAGKKLYAFERAPNEYEKHSGRQSELDPHGRYKYASKGAFISPKQIERVAAGGLVAYKPNAPTFNIKRGVVFTNREIISTHSTGSGQA